MSHDITIKLTDEQRKQILSATGKDLKEVRVNVAAAGSLSELDLDKVAGGAKPVGPHC
jgi:hypothetical protein